MVGHILKKWSCATNCSMFCTSSYSGSPHSIIRSSSY